MLGTDRRDVHGARRPHPIQSLPDRVGQDMVQELAQTDHLQLGRLAVDPVDSHHHIRLHGPALETLLDLGLTRDLASPTERVNVVSSPVRGPWS